MQIQFTDSYKGLLEQVNSNRTFLQKKYGQPVRSSVDGKDLSIMCAPPTDTEEAIFKGYNVGDVIVSGTRAEVMAGTKDLTDDAAETLVLTGLAIEI